MPATDRPPEPGADDEAAGLLRGWLAFLDPSIIPLSMSNWHAEMQRCDELLDRHPSFDDRAAFGKRAVRWCVVTALQEYARHNGHADIVRERIDGLPGE